tara:strand:+ start:2154 stop:2972 length:819 start_codon:yes stop_codon:yes gene_type:complete
MNLTQVSVVICNKNSFNYLKKSIPIYKSISLCEIIVIDGNSTDGSLEYLKKEGIKIISDQGKGLSYSRNLGVINSKGSLIFMAGPDDICNKKFFDNLLIKFSDSNYDAATTLFQISNPTNYLDRSLNMWFKYIRKSGDAKVIGTPTIFKRNTFDKVSYNIETIGFDDTDISEQLLVNDFKIGVLSINCDQANNNSYKDILKKFQLYGKSDINYHNYHKQNKSKIFHKFLKTYLHPAKHFISFTFFLISKMQILTVPFAIIITINRYIGFFKK